MKCNIVISPSISTFHRFHETLITSIDHHCFMCQKYHGQRKDGLKCHINLRRKDKMNHQLITWPWGVLVLDIDDCVNHNVPTVHYA